MDPHAELMLRAAQGDRDAFSRLVRATQGLVSAVIYRVIGDARETEDLAQEVYLRAWEARKRYRPEARFSTWIGTIAARLCLNEREKRRRRSSAPPVSSPPSPVSPSSDDRDLVRRAVMELPPNQRMAIALRYFGDLSDRETAEALELSLSATQALLFRARQRLIELLP